MLLSGCAQKESSNDILSIDGVTNCIKEPDDEVCIAFKELNNQSVQHSYDSYANSPIENYTYNFAVTVADGTEKLIYLRQRPSVDNITIDMSVDNFSKDALSVN